MATISKKTQRAESKISQTSEPSQATQTISFCLCSSFFVCSKKLEMVLLLMMMVMFAMKSTLSNSSYAWHIPPRHSHSLSFPSHFLVSTFSTSESSLLLPTRYVASSPFSSSSSLPTSSSSFLLRRLFFPLEQVESRSSLYLPCLIEILKKARNDRRQEKGKNEASLLP